MGATRSMSPVTSSDARMKSSSAGLAALNKRTGALVWKAALTGDVGYTSPLLARLGGVNQVLIVTTKGIAGFEPSTGRPLWSWYGQWLCKIPIVSPVLVGDGQHLLDLFRL